MTIMAAIVTANRLDMSERLGGVAYQGCTRVPAIDPEVVRAQDARLDAIAELIIPIVEVPLVDEDPYCDVDESEAQYTVRNVH